MGAHIISMSWTIPGEYMAKMSGATNPVICIGGAQEAGYGDERALSEAEFFFPGQINGLTDSLPSLKSKFSSSIGSSVATALAVGFTALIIVLVNMSPEHSKDTSTDSDSDPTTLQGYRKLLQDPNNIRLIFQDLLPKPDPKRATEQRTAVIIPVEKYIKPDRLLKSLRGISEADMSKHGGKLLEPILNRLLR